MTAKKSDMPVKDGEANRLGQRVKRYAQVGAGVGGLAARVAGQRFLGLTPDNDRTARDLKVALGGLKGPIMKVAQMLATVPDIV
ncbi:MAG TPA: AarF/ABC1/UbiB kinase family protein, partial [Parvibaculum sp.]